MAREPDNPAPASEPVAEHLAETVPLDGAGAFTDTALPIEAPSKKGAPGAFLRRLVQRFSSQQLERQEIFNRVVLKAVRENREHSAAVSRHLGRVSESLEHLQKSFENESRAASAYVGRVSETVEHLQRDIEAQGRVLGTNVGELSASLEQLQTSVEAQAGEHGEVLGQLSGTLEQLDAAFDALGSEHGEYLGRLSEKLDSLKEGVEAQGEEHGAYLAELSAGLEQAQAGLDEQGRVHGEFLGAVSGNVAELRDSVKEHAGFVGKVSERVEGLSEDVADQKAEHGKHLGLLSRTMEQLQAAHGKLHETARAQGKHLDDMASRVADFDEVEQELEEGILARIDALGEALADLDRRLHPNLHFDHFDFARRYRGEEADLQERMEAYAVLFGQVDRLVDVGCGRGEFLEACRAKDIGAYGVEPDGDMVSRCRMKGLEVVQADALEHLRGLEDRSLDGVFMAQVIEHLTNSEIVDFIALAAQKMKRGAKIIIETINPDSFTALRWFFLDPTHRQPVSSETVKFLLEDAGFTVRDVLHLSPVPADEALKPLSASRAKAKGAAAEAPATPPELVRNYNENLKKLNRVLFGDQDYAVIAER